MSNDIHFFDRWPGNEKPHLKVNYFDEKDVIVVLGRERWHCVV